jgi:hypothetical protein
MCLSELERFIVEEEMTIEYRRFKSVEIQLTVRLLPVPKERLRPNIPYF